MEGPNRNSLSLTGEDFKVIKSAEKLGGERKVQKWETWGSQPESIHDSKIQNQTEPKHMFIQNLIACYLNGDPERKDRNKTPKWGEWKWKAGCLSYKILERSTSNNLFCVMKSPDPADGAGALAKCQSWYWLCLSLQDPPWRFDLSTFEASHRLLCG